MELQFGMFGFLPTTKIQNKMHVLMIFVHVHALVSCAMQLFLCLSLCSDRIIWWIMIILTMGKSEYAKLEHHAGQKKEKKGVDVRCLQSISVVLKCCGTIFFFQIKAYWFLGMLLPSSQGTLVYSTCCLLQWSFPTALRGNCTPNQKLACFVLISQNYQHI